MWSVRSELCFFQCVSEHVIRYSVYGGQDENGVTSYLVTVQILVGESNDQQGVSQDPEGPNGDGPGPQDPPNGQQSFMIPVPQESNGAHGSGAEGDSDDGSTLSSASSRPEGYAVIHEPSDMGPRLPLADLNGRTHPVNWSQTAGAETRPGPENPAELGPQPNCY